MGRNRTLWHKFKIWFCSTGIYFPVRLATSLRSIFSGSALSSASSHAAAAATASSSSTASASTEYILESSLRPSTSPNSSSSTTQSYHYQWWPRVLYDKKVLYLLAFIIPLLPSLLVSLYFSIPSSSLHKLDKRMERGVGFQFEAEQNRKLIESIEQQKHDLKVEVESLIEDIKEHNDKMTGRLETHLEYMRQKRRDELEIVGNEFVKPPIEGELNYLFDVNFKQMIRKGVWLILFCKDQCHQYVARWQVLGRELKGIMAVGMADQGVSNAFEQYNDPSLGSVFIVITIQGEQIEITNEELTSTKAIQWVETTLESLL